MALRQGLRTALQVVLVILIVVLAYGVYRSTTDPWRVQQQRVALTERSRARMSMMRAALVRYHEVRQQYPTSLDSLVRFTQADPLFMQQTGDGQGVDSMIVAPRSGRRFQYWVNDTSRVSTYLIKDPDSDDYIGTLDGDVARLHAASWE